MRRHLEPRRAFQRQVGCCSCKAAGLRWHKAASAAAHRRRSLWTYFLVSIKRNEVFVSSSLMLRFPVYDLSNIEFEKLVGLICREVLGPAVTTFAAGKDGGKDAKFSGSAQAFPSTANPETGKFIIQAKHTSSPVGSCSDDDFETKTLNEELPKVKRMFDAGELTHYILFTNRRKTGGAEDRIGKRVLDETGVNNFWLRGYEDIERELLAHPELARAVGLDKLRSPILFTPDDIQCVIKALYNHRQTLPEAFDSEHDFRDYPGIEAKNSINGLSDAYFDYIKENSLMHFAAIEDFLKNPRNRVIKEQYHAVADELKGQLIVHRDRFSTFDDALEHLHYLIPERSPAIAVASHRPLLKVVIHYMYVNCDIGRKKPVT